MSGTTCILVISIIMVIIITIMCIFAFIEKDKKNKKENKTKKLIKAQKIVDSILEDYTNSSKKQLETIKLKELDYNLKLIISRCELLKKIPPTYENYLMIYNGLLSFSKKNCFEENLYFF